MKRVVHIIKAGGNRPSELYSRKKLHASLVAALISVRTHDGDAHTIANSVCNAVESWLEQRPEVTSSDIRTTATKRLEHYNPDAAYTYKQYRYTI
jgi:transcriptional regulator NrdR family protein